MASLFRLFRILKLARILRLLESEIFSDLLAMIHGMSGGMSRLMWSMAFFVLLLYVVSLMFRELFGRGKTVSCRGSSILFRDRCSQPSGAVSEIAARLGVYRCSRKYTRSTGLSFASSVALCCSLSPSASST